MWEKKIGVGKMQNLTTTKSFTTFTTQPFLEAIHAADR